MSGNGDDVSAKLKITRGYGKLLGLPDIAHGARVVVLERIGNYEIRMFETPEASSVGAPLFWMELFDLSALTSLDSCGCYDVGAAVAVFEAFASQAGHLNECSRCADSGTDD
jgi:hypothetical protein